LAAADPDWYFDGRDVPGVVLVRPASLPGLNVKRVILKEISAPLLIVAFLLLVSIGWRMKEAGPRLTPPATPVRLRGSGEIVRIAATGDALIHGQLPSPRTDRGFDGVVQVLQNTTLGLTNLEENLLDPSNVPPNTPGTPIWPYGTKREAEDLRRMGFTMISLANNHAIDYGVQGMQQTARILDHAGLLHAGSGDDLAQARAPVYLGTPPRRVAMIAVAVSAAPESRATYTHGDIKGRPGVSSFKYAPDVTVDPSTFATLKGFATSNRATPAAKSDHLTLSGTPVKKGQRTAVTFVPDARDTDEILTQIKDARSKADVVIVMVHSHEPSNQSQAPAEFVQKFARAAIDAGASLVVGQGPHQLRGVEVYKGGVIFHSLGNFVFDYSAVDPKSVDAYDAGTDLYRLAMGAMAESESSPAPSFDEPVWWESITATIAFDHGVLRSIQLLPIDLGVDLPPKQRGTPRLATPERGNEILQRLARLSKDLGTQVRIENGLGLIDLTPP
jgi:poly-gamma-glutamate capsule biosynthesis protein CapA/YwtB (metallophosphatase superfamily)